MRLLPLALVVAVPGLASLTSTCYAARGDWPSYLGDKASSHFSNLDQITPANVEGLKPAWTWSTGDVIPGTSQIQCNPLIIGGVMYASTARMSLAALDAATGKELWRFIPPEVNGVNRGVSYWSEGEEKRLLYGNGHWLYAVDPATGKLIETFGDHGRVDLAQGLDRDVTGLAIQANTPGVIYKDLIMLSFRAGEGPGPAAPGHIRAYDVRTGQQRWIFHTLPQPGEPGYETWPADAWKTVGGVNAWAGLTLDEERGLLFCPIGSGTFDFWGGNRQGQNLYADCLLVLDARTGKHVWHFQFTHHDMWDRDPPAPPVLLTVKRDGRSVPAVAQTTKSGHVWVFHRETGEPLFPVEETVVPSSDLAGEAAWPTQPLPLKPAPFARQLFTADEITNRTPEARRAVMERFVRIRPHVPFTPPSKEGSVIFPGFDGGAEWGGAAVDPQGVLYVNSNEMPWILSMIETSGATSLGQQIYLQNCTGCHGPERKGNPAANIPSLVGIESRLTHEQVFEVITKGRAVMPPWGFLTEVQREALVSFLRSEKAAQKNDAGAAHEYQTYQPDQETAGFVPPPYTHTGYNRWLDPEGYPAIRPPWGTLNAIDLNSGEYLWKVPLGEYPELTAKGVPVTGSENYGGPLVTSGGVLFIAATKDECFRAFDAKTGKQLWKVKLPQGGYATPSTYEVNGRQYVVIACGGGKMGTPSGDTYMAFALGK